MSDFEFGFDSKKKGLKETTVVFHKSTKPEIYILLEEELSDSKLRKIKSFLDANLQGLQYDLLLSLKYVPEDEDLKNGIIKFYSENRIDLKTYIPEWSKVVTFGRALFAVTQSNDLEIEGFCDTILNQTSFFSAELKCQIFPTFKVDEWLHSDTFERNWSIIQFKNAREFKLAKKRIREPEIIEPENPNEFLISKTDYQGIISFDLETKGLDPWATDGKIICLTLAFEEDLYKGYYFDWSKLDRGVLNNFFKGKKLVGNNLKYDVKWLVVHGELDRENLEIYWDNMNSSHFINETQSSSLKSDAWLYTTLGGYDLP